MPSTDRRTDTTSVAPNGSAHGPASEALADKRMYEANVTDSTTSAASTSHSETTERTHDGDSPAAEEIDDEPFLPARQLPLDQLTVHIHARVQGFLDRPSHNERVCAAQEQAR